MIFKLVSERRGEHIHESVFVAENKEEIFAQAGKLIFLVGEWQEFGATFLLGAAQTKGRVEVITVGDKEVCKP